MKILMNNVVVGLSFFASLFLRVTAYTPRLIPNTILQHVNKNINTYRSTQLWYQVMTQEEEHVMLQTVSTNNIVKSSTSDIRTHFDPPSLGDIRKLLPTSVFQVDTKTSLLYFLLDFMAVVVSMGSLYTVVTSDMYHTFPIYIQAIAVLPIQMITGFAMWCMWCIGHDAGHTTISKDRKYGKLINRVVGEISHSMICLTPFIPWKKSHLQHHLNHNHIEKDYSHQWFVREESHNLHPLIKLSYQTRNIQLPILYLVYLLLGVPDGGHVYFYGRLWNNESFNEKMKASISVLISIVTAASLWTSMGTTDFVVVCMVPWLILSLWLFTVTYLQHHSEDGKLYTDDTWTFTKGAFQTVDRNYGQLINRLSHHMMDGHVVHHLFFTRVPHYHLKVATDALVIGMKERGQDNLYKQIDTFDFGFEIIKQFDENWFFCNESQVVRK
jgi:acyl-lipid omega-3 desaturase